MFALRIVVAQNPKVQLGNDKIALLIKAKEAILDKENQRNFNQAYNATTQIAKLFQNQDILLSLLAIGVAHEAKLQNQRKKAVLAIDLLVTQKGSQLEKKVFDNLIENIARIKVLMAAVDVELIQKLYKEYQKLYILARIGEQLTNNLVSKIVLLALRSKAQSAFSRYSFLNQ